MNFGRFLLLRGKNRNKGMTCNREKTAMRWNTWGGIQGSKKGWWLLFLGHDREGRGGWWHSRVILISMWKGAAVQASRGLELWAVCEVHVVWSDRWTDQPYFNCPLCDPLTPLLVWQTDRPTSTSTAPYVTHPPTNKSADVTPGLKKKNNPTYRWGL